MSFDGIAMGGTKYVRDRILNILRQRVPDPGIDDIEAPGGFGYGPVRDAETTFTITGDGVNSVYAITPTDPNNPVVSIYNVYQGTTLLFYAWDYLIQWGDKTGNPQQLTTRIQLPAVLALGATLTGTYRYGKTIDSKDNRVIAQGSFINTSFSRGAMPLPKIQLVFQETTIRPAATGDDYDSQTGRGIIYHDPMIYEARVYSAYLEECEDLTTLVSSALMQGAHDRNRLIPEIRVTGIRNVAYDPEKKEFMWTVVFEVLSQQVF